VKVGRVLLDVAPLVENGNAVPITVSVESPMTRADHVRRIAVFNELNPQRDVAVFTLGPRAGRARVANPASASRPRSGSSPSRR
jgi:sulfur-oxidizing protein SoxY